MRPLFFTIACVVCIHAGAQKTETTHVNPEAVNQYLFLNVVDVVTRNDVSGFHLVICKDKDTISNSIDTAGQQPFQLVAAHHYTITITKPGYETLHAEWDQPPHDTADVYVDFYMRKSVLTREEQKEAMKQSKRPIIRTTGQEGGFEYVGVPKGSICEVRIDVYKFGQSGEGKWIYKEIN